MSETVALISAAQSLKNVTKTSSVSFVICDKGSSLFLLSEVSHNFSGWDKVPFKEGEKKNTLTLDLFAVNPGLKANRW